ncbi:MAG: hypothetical protein AAFP15_15025, partial [Bacteroidota bacterium]
NSQATDWSDEGSNIIDQVIECVDDVLEKVDTQVSQIGISTFGIVDSVNGVALGGKYLPRYRNVRIREIFSNKYLVPVGVYNYSLHQTSLLPGCFQSERPREDLPRHTLCLFFQCQCL